MRANQGIFRAFEDVLRSIERSRLGRLSKTVRPTEIGGTGVWGEGLARR